jgi:hypothetical protein
MSSTVSLTRYVLPYPTVTARFLAETWWTCHSGSRHTWRNRCDSIVATGEAISVVPPTIRRALDPVLSPVRGWRGVVPSWDGIPCRLGQATVPLPIQENPGQFLDLPILVLLPQQDLPDAPPYVLLGVQFLIAHRAQLLLDTANPGHDRLIFP